MVNRSMRLRMVAQDKFDEVTAGAITGFSHPALRNPVE
jgi:hypothetical protein